MPLDNPFGAVKIGEGTYTGDDSVNRAIPHGLTVTPKIVLIHCNAVAQFRIAIGEAKVLHASAASFDESAVTAMDSTNFYVGKATSYPKSANENTRDYYWVAIG